MNKNVVGWFEIPVKDMARAKKFYNAVFQKELTDYSMPGLEMAVFPYNHDAPNSPGSLIKMDRAADNSQLNPHQPSLTGVVIYFTTDNISHELGRIEVNGGKILKPKTAIGENGFIALIQDTEGNCIGLQSMK